MCVIMHACIFAYLVYADIYVVSSSAAEGGQRLHSEGLTYTQLKEDKKMSPNLECYMYTITFRRFRQQKYIITVVLVIPHFIPSSL